MYVAGLLADAGWDIYFPSRDKGFDMIVSRPVGQGAIVRPIQVKGKYATEDKTDKAVYGYVGKLTATHDDMILVIPYFTTADAVAPHLVAWVPFSVLKARARPYRFQPAKFVSGKPHMRRDYQKYFGEEGLRSLNQLATK